jgi:hypothetical protein
MKLPATEPVEGTPFAVAVWKAEDSTRRVRVTHGAQPAGEYRGVQDGWEPLRIRRETDAATIADLCMHEVDPPAWRSKLCAAISLRASRIR